MSMLAEPKKKMKWGLNPRGNLWAKDESKFGQQLLEKMGWQKGKGLGKHENGRTENINVIRKDDNKGVGCDDKTNNWVSHQDDFNTLLAELNKGYSNQNGVGLSSKQLEDVADNKKKPVSLEVRSKSFKSRVHYKKFVSGKDVSQYSVEDIGCIFGKKQINSTELTISNNSGEKDDTTDSLKTELPAKETELSNFGGVTTFTSATSVSDYFVQKMKLKTLAQKFVDQAVDVNGSCEKDSAGVCKDVVAKSEKKSKRRKLAQLKETGEIAVLKNTDVLHPDEPKPAILSNEIGSSQQSLECNSKGSECSQDKLDAATVGESIIKKNRREQANEHLEEQDSCTEFINIIEHRATEQPELVQENCKITNNGSSSDECNTSVSELLDADSCFKEKKKFKQQVQDTLCKNNPAHSGLKTLNDCQGKKKACQSSTKTTPSKLPVKRHSDIDLLKRYQTMCNNSSSRTLPHDSHRQIPENSLYRNNLESWNAVLKLARKLKRYEQVEKKITMDDVLSSTNICNQRGYGVRPDD